MGLLEEARKRKEGKVISKAAVPRKVKEPETPVQDLPELNIGQIESARQDLDIQGLLPEPPSDQPVPQPEPPKKETKGGFFSLFKKKSAESSRPGALPSPFSVKDLDDFAPPPPPQSMPDMEPDIVETPQQAIDELKMEDEIPVPEAPEADFPVPPPPDVPDELTQPEQTEQQAKKPEPKKEGEKWSLFGMFKKEKKELPSVSAPSPVAQGLESPLPDDAFTHVETDMPPMPEMPDFKVPESPSADDYAMPSASSDGMDDFARGFSDKDEIVDIPSVQNAPAPKVKKLPPLPIASQDEMLAQGMATDMQAEPKPTKTMLKMIDRKERLQKEVAGLKDEVLGLNNELMQKKQLMTENEKLLDEKEESINMKINKLEELKSHIDKTKSDIMGRTEKMEKLKALASQVYADRDAIQKRYDEIAERERALMQKEKFVEDRDRMLAEKERRVTEFEKQMKNFEDQIKEQELLRTRKDKQIRDREAALAQREAALVEKEERLSKEYKELEEGEFKEYIEQIMKEIGTEAAKTEMPVFAQMAGAVPINVELINYISRHLKKGFNQDRIMSALKGAGWTDEEVRMAMNEALSGFEKGTQMKQIPPLMPETTMAETGMALQQLNQLMNQARNAMKSRQIGKAQDALMKAKQVYDYLKIDDKKKELLRYELQDLKTEIDLALLG